MCSMISRAAAEGAYRQTATDDLAERREIGVDAVMRLGAAARDPETGHHLVENQYAAVCVAQRAQALEEAGHRRDAVHVSRHRFHDHGSDVSLPSREAAQYAALSL